MYILILLTFSRGTKGQDITSFWDSIEASQQWKYDNSFEMFSADYTEAVLGRSLCLQNGGAQELGCFEVRKSPVDLA